MNTSRIELKDNETGKTFFLNEHNKFIYEYIQEDREIVLKSISFENNVMFENGTNYVFPLKDWNEYIASKFVNLQ